MIRIPNPGSNLDVFVRIFRELHNELHGRTSFDLDDITLAMIRWNNVTSQGAVGEEALKRSTRADRSRDPLYNQSKMYAELFRTLGWIQSTTSKLTFAFSWLGKHVATAVNPKGLVIECLMGLSYPNQVLGVQGGQSLRVFSSILRSMGALGGRITRDEMIAGPLSIENDRDEALFDEMISVVSSCRGTTGALDDVVSQIGKQRRISKVTMGNYTRFPIAAIQWAGWAEKRGRSDLFLTDFGKETLDQLTSLFQDFRLSDYIQIPNDAQEPFVRCAFYGMLGRSGFDLGPVEDQFLEDTKVLQTYGLPYEDILFSPFQQVDRTSVNAAFPELEEGLEDAASGSSLLTNYGEDAEQQNADGAVIMFETVGEWVESNDDVSLLTREINDDLQVTDGDVLGTVELMCQRYSSANQDRFYPLVTTLFQMLGFDCRMSRQGVNYERADAMIVSDKGSIPIEIKSPGEELEISVKAVRQALENRIILLSRNSYPVVSGMTSLVVGFNAPNERSEVHELINDIHRVFDERIGVIDFTSLLLMAVHSVANHGQARIYDFETLKGVISVEYAPAS